MKAFVLTEWLQQYFEPEGDGPAYLRLYELICSAILNGYMAAGNRLPSTRDMASDLGIARNTVIQVYEQLTEEGYVSAGIGRGTYVQDISFDLVEKPLDEQIIEPIDHNLTGHNLSRRGRKLVTNVGFSNRQRGAFMPGIPDVREFPVKTWLRIQNKIWRNEPWDLLSYAPAGGYGPLRQAISEYLSSVRSVVSQAHQVVMTTGIHQGIDISVRLLCDPGDTVWIEEPAYWGTRNIITSLGLKVVPIKVDDEGINPTEANQSKPPKLIIVAPSHQYPLGMVMSLARRRFLLEFARQNSCWIIEDDYDSEFRYGSRPLPSLQGMDKAGRVLYAGSFSKTLSPGLRVGFLVVPESLADAFANTVADLYREGNMMLHATLAEFLRDGYLNSHIRRVRRRYAERRSCILDCINNHFGDELEIIGGDAGLHLILSLPNMVKDNLVMRDAMQQGVVTRSLSNYYFHKENIRPGLLLGYAGVTPDEIKPNFDILARTIKGYL